MLDAVVRKLLLLQLGCHLLLAQTAPREKAGDYPAHAEGSRIAIGAEYLVHSLSNGKQSFYTPDYLVVEIAVYPLHHLPVQISAGQFELRINGHKSGIPPQPPGFVAASLKYPDWTRKPNLTAEVGAGQGGITIGRQPRVERFPGDPTPRQTRLPGSPRAPDPVYRSGEQAAPAETAGDVVQKTALIEGEIRNPVSGFLYFEYSGKTKKIKSLDLAYRDGETEIVIKLF